MKIITLEEHFTDQRIIDENNKYHTQAPPASPEEGHVKTNIEIIKLNMRN